MKWLRKTPTSLLAILALFLGCTPFLPEPHIVEKLRLLSNNSLRNPLDIFDLIFHLSPTLLLLIKLSLPKEKNTINTSKIDQNKQVD